MSVSTNFESYSVELRNNNRLDLTLSFFFEYGTFYFMIFIIESFKKIKKCNCVSFSDQTCITYPDEGNLFKMARVKQDVIEDETLESHVGKVTIDVNHILDRLVELDIRVAHVHQCSSPTVIVLTFEVLHVLREPQRQSVIPFVLCFILNTILDWNRFIF